MNTLLDAAFLDSMLPVDPDPQDAGSHVLSLLFDALAHGILVVNERSQIVHANQAARTELRRHRVLEKVGSEVHAVVPVDAKVFQNAMVKAVSGKRSLIKMAGGGQSLTLALVPLKCDPSLWGTRIALFFSRVEVCESGMFGFFARSHGLTQTEEQVLAILCRGRSTPEIAVQMKVAVSTVRSHVRSLCAKTGSSGVRELVNRVAVLPPVAPLHLVQIH